MSGRILRWTGIGIALSAVVFAVVLASRFGADPGLVDSPLIGNPAPQFQLESLDGTTTVSLDDLRENIVVINFFASWCLECRAEHDDLVATSNVFGGEGVRFVQISYQENVNDSSEYLDRAGRSDSTLYLQDPGSRTAIAYGVFGIPETFFINEEGTVVGKVIGETDALMLGATIDAIRRGETPGQSVTGSTQQERDG